MTENINESSTDKRQHTDACNVLVWMCDNCSNVVTDSIEKADEIINDPKYKRILVSISGGSDSDDVLDLCTKLDVSHKCIYVWFNTGLEYQATKDHLKYLESKYHIEIIREKAIKPIPVSCKEFGQPFLSKRVSDYVTRLQKHGFQWEDEPFEVLYKKYPKCRSALRWWCNMWDSKGEKGSQFNINRNAYLKEFLISNHPTFNISNKCCDYAKKNLPQFEAWIKFLESLGYSNFWQDMNAKDYGTPQSRNRTFMVSILDPSHQITFEFPKPVELNSEFEDILVDEDTVDDRFYIDTPRASQLIQKLINDGVLVTSRERVTVDLSLNNPQRKKIANCITAHLTKDGNWIERRKSKNNGVVSFVKKNETFTL